MEAGTRDQHGDRTRDPNGSLEQIARALRGLEAAPEAADMISQIEWLEQIKAAVVAATARISTCFETEQRAAQRLLGVPSARRGRGVADQLALARHLSPSRASRELGFARALRDDLPATDELLRTGRIGEEVAKTVHLQTIHLDALPRQLVDAELAESLPGTTVGEAQALTRKAVYRADPAGAVARTAKAAQDRRVWTRPAPDTMCTFSALVPAAHGVAAYAAVRRAAEAAVATGQAAGRSVQQIMADVTIERLTGQATAAGVNVEVQLVMTPAMLFGQHPGHEPPTELDSSTESAAPSACGGVDPDPDGPAWLHGYGPIPAALARAIIAGVPDLLGSTPTELDRGQAWVRRVFTDPITGQLTSYDSRRRRFDGTLRRFIQYRDRVCRTPGCGAPIRDLDHVHSHVDDGPTSIQNGAGVCQRFNLVKEIPGWHLEVLHPGPDASSPPGTPGHTIKITTPTGKTYYSTAPPVPGTAPARQPRQHPFHPPRSPIDITLTDLLCVA